MAAPSMTASWMAASGMAAPWMAASWMAPSEMVVPSMAASGTAALLTLNKSKTFKTPLEETKCLDNFYFACCLPKHPVFLFNSTPSTVS